MKDASVLRQHTEHARRGPYPAGHGTRATGLILASASPRRAELMRAAGFEFQVIMSAEEEPEEKPGVIPVELWPMCLAYMKAAAVYRELRARSVKSVVLAADTIVVVDEKAGPRILNKADDRAHARRMLRMLSGKLHRVITGICLMTAAGHRLSSAQAVCRIKRLPASRVEAYLNTGLWKGKAGAYGIQDKGDPFVTLLEGDITTVMGLPMELVKRELACFWQGASDGQ